MIHVCSISEYIFIISVQRDHSGAEDLTITSEYGGNFFCLAYFYLTHRLCRNDVCPSTLLHPGPSSDSDLTSQAVETDSLADLDDGMASGRTSPNYPQGGATKVSSNSPRLPSLHDRRTPSPVPVSSALNSEVKPGRLLLFSGSLKKVSSSASKDVKSDYLDRASELISLAVQKENEQDFHAAFSCYRNGVDQLLRGVQG